MNQTELDRIKAWVKNEDGFKGFRLDQHRDFAVRNLPKLVEEVERLTKILREIANTDYRGNRSTESVIAWRALQPVARP